MSPPTPVMRRPPPRRERARLRLRQPLPGFSPTRGGPAEFPPSGPFALLPASPVPGVSGPEPARGTGRASALPPPRAPWAGWCAAAEGRGSRPRSRPGRASRPRRTMRSTKRSTSTRSSGNSGSRPAASRTALSMAPPCDFARAAARADAECSPSSSPSHAARPGISSAWSARARRSSPAMPSSASISSDMVRAC